MNYKIISITSLILSLNIRYTLDIKFYLRIIVIIGNYKTIGNLYEL